MRRTVGYTFLRDHLSLPVLESRTIAQIGPVKAVERTAGHEADSRERLSIPAGMLAVDASPLQHLLFAMRHEGIDMAIIMASLRKIQADDLVRELRKTPGGANIRKVCMLWEEAHSSELPIDDVAIGGAFTPVFQPDHYLTGRVVRNRRWRVDFNGIGTPWSCITIRKTPEILGLIQQDSLGQAREFAGSIEPSMLERAMSWAYLSETEGSFAIERETPSPSRADAFVALLKAASRSGGPLSEQRLCELQNAIVTNPMDHAFEYRGQQNYLKGPGRGALAVTYVPPAPDLAGRLTDQIIDLINDPPAGLPPLVLAAAASFGFVFAHPFMDGNGRLSRYLMHHVIAQSGQLPKAASQSLMLPISMAMKRHEGQYLAALERFSRGARELCQVRWIDEGNYDFTWIEGADIAFRYWDATDQTVFTLRMAQIALEQDLQQEAQFLRGYDRAYKQVNEAVDLRGPDLSNMIRWCFDGGGLLSKNRRKQYLAKTGCLVAQAEEIFHAVETAVREHLIDGDMDTGDAEKADAPRG